MDYSHHAEEVAAPEFFYLFFAEAFGAQAAGEVDDLGCVGAADDAAVAVEVGAYAHVVDTGYLYHVADVAYGVVDGGTTLLAQESVVEAHLCHAA